MKSIVDLNADFGRYLQSYINNKSGRKDIFVRTDDKISYFHAYETDIYVNFEEENQRLLIICGRDDENLISGLEKNKTRGKVLETLEKRAEDALRCSPDFNPKNRIYISGLSEAGEREIKIIFYSKNYLQEIQNLQELFLQVCDAGVLQMIKLNNLLNYK